MRLARVLSTFVGIAAVITACAPAPPPPPPDTSAADNAALTKLRSDYEAAWESGNAERVGALYATNAVFYPMEQPTLNGRAAIVEFFKAQFSQVTPSQFKINSAGMTVSGNLATDHGTVDIAMTPKAKGAEMVKLQGRFIVVVMKNNGTWLLQHVIDNSATPMAPPPAAKGK
jgi:uncharacterized protein (TIGR02246 family)